MHYSLWAVILYSGQAVDPRCDWPDSEDIPGTQQSQNGSRGISSRQNEDLRRGARRCICDFQLDPIPLMNKYRPAVLGEGALFTE